MLKKILFHPFVFFPTLAFLVFWPVSLHIFSLKNDALTYYYPVRTLISDALHNHELPLWTPYINMGYPIHADMQSGAWSPLVWIFSLVSNYSLYGFHLELLFYFAFAGIGFYYLCKSFGFSRYTALILGVAYQLCGFMTDSVQFFVCIAAACYLPWIFIFIKRLFATLQIKDAIATGFFLSLLFTGSYPSLFIITAYFLFAYFLFVFFSTDQKRGYLKKSFLPLSVMLAVFILLSAPAIISFIQHLPFIERGKKQSLEFVQENSLVPGSLISFISPFSTTASEGWLNTDPLMRNSYIGIIPFIFLLLGICNQKIRRLKTVQFFLLSGLIMFLLALGSNFFLHKWAYYILPFFNSFRHPALFRLFGIFCCLIVAGFALDEFEKNSSYKVFLKKTNILLAVIAAALFGLFVFFLKNALAFFSSGSFSVQNLKPAFYQLTFTERYMLQLPIILAVLFFLFLALKKQHPQFLILLICIADMVICTQINMPVTVIGSKRFSTIESLLNRNPNPYPLPGKASIEINSANSFDQTNPSISTLPGERIIGRNEYYITPGNLSSQEQFYSSPIKDSVFKNPVFYFADTILRKYPAGSITSNAFAIAEPSSVFATHSNHILNNGLVKPTGISSNSLLCETTTTTPSLLILLQNYYPGWKAFVDGAPTNIEKVNTTFMCIEIPVGKHNIAFKYEPDIIRYAWYISLISLTLVLLFFIHVLRTRFF